jgi:hypothetical protein
MMTKNDNDALNPYFWTIPQGNPAAAILGVTAAEVAARVETEMAGKVKARRPQQ